MVISRKVWCTFTQNNQSYEVGMCFPELDDGQEGPPDIRIARISTTPTRWMIGKSRQNNCFNVHVDGSMFRLPNFPAVPSATSVSGTRLQNSAGAYFNDLISPGQFIFSDWSDYPQFSGAAVYPIFLWATVRIGRWVTWDVFTWTHGGGSGPSVFDYTPTNNSWHLLGETPKKCITTDYFKAKSSYLRLTVHVDFDNKIFEVIEAPTEEELEAKVYSKPSSWSTYWAEPIDPVYPVTGKAQNYDVRFDDIEYDLDAEFAKSLDQVDFTTSNGIAYGLDAKDILSNAKSDLASLRTLATGTPGKLKIAASLFLSVHYGWKLMASDTFEFAEALNEFSKNSNRRVHSSVDGTCSIPQRGQLTLRRATAHQNVYYDPYAQISSMTLQLAEAMDVVPDISNVWDMIPFSFVVDWFTNVGELAEGIDAFYTLVQEHRVLGTIISTKEIYEQSCYDAVGKYTFVVYERRCIQDWYPIPDFSFQFKNPLTSLYHWLEASALVVSTKP